MANTGNLVIFFGGAGILAYLMWGQLITPTVRRISSAEATIRSNNELIIVGEGLQRKLAALKAENEAAGEVVNELAKLFPAADIDTSKLTGILDGAPRELPGVNIIKAPPLTKDTLAWQPRTTPLEDLSGLYKSMVGTDKPLEGAKLEGTLKLSRMDQNWELEADWDAFPALLVKLQTLGFYFEVTKCDVYGVVDPTFKKDYRPPKTGPKTVPRKIKSQITITTIAMPPLPAAPKQ